MRAFDYFQPTEIRYGTGRLSEVGEVVAEHGTRCLLVTRPPKETGRGLVSALHNRVKAYLEGAGVAVEHFTGVIPNPTTDSVTAGAALAKEFGADVILGIGGGSSMDTAKAIAVEATHPGTAWDYLWFSEKQPTGVTLPIVAVTTTSGTGSQVTQVAVVTNPAEKNKSAIFNSNIYAKVAIIDPELMITVPQHITASTGFDVFCHAFESYLHVNASPYTDIMALEAIRIVSQYLPVVVEDGSNLEAREAMAWADTLGGLCIANAGVTLPHGIGMTIGGYCPHVMHGEALAVTYPEFTRYTFPYAVDKFAAMGRIFDSTLRDETDEVTAERSCEVLDAFQKRIGMWLNLKGLGISEEEVVLIADHSHVLPDYRNNPKVATRDEIYEMLMSSYERV